MAGFQDLSRLLKRWKRAPKSSAAARPSAAQFLPSRIIQRIAFYTAAVDIGYSSSEGIRYDQVSRATKALVGVSRSWRVAVITLFYRHFVLDINCSAMWISPSRRMVHKDCDDINDSVRHLAKSVYLTAPFDGIFNGRVVQILDSNHYSDAVFPEVTVLRLNFYSGTTVPVQETQDFDFFIVQFCSYIQRLFPRAVEYRFQVSLFTDTDDSRMVGRLLGGLIQNSSCQVAEYVHSSSGVQVSGLIGVVGLTHISIQDQACVEDCVELTRQNAATLVALDLGLVDAPDYLSRLVTKDDGTPLVYPRLTKLSINANLLPKDKDIYFPVLRDFKATTGSLRVANVLPSPAKTPPSEIAL
ncbi:hypothetical protein J3B02_005444 [Coemansia erecta]|uniref:Uncharacterized protein n=1 Tax=Coemansia asiatica TaxID=1052880 RepID=A0A9W7XD49_9FUNG|nr:hypothetical protein LPJ64_006097 [Coemansia asiatica]KAJ2842879.1 hypothetical protein J3B02_005444 [Coemansia erecta]KAJ2874515.1 hypothetical protein FB639_004091 [Coemansia asiatica]